MACTMNDAGDDAEDEEDDEDDEDDEELTEDGDVEGIGTVTTKFGCVWWCFFLC